MKILVTGAGGFFGSAITRALLAAGHQVRVLLEPHDPAPALAALPVEKISGDILDLEQVRTACQDCEAVVHAAGRTNLRIAGRDRLRRINVEGTRTLCRALTGTSVTRLIYISSLCTLGAHDGPRPVSEASPAPNANTHQNTYCVSKRRAESIAFTETDSQVAVVALLPAMLWGPEDRSLSSTGLARLILRTRRAPYPRRGGVSLLDVEDAAQGVVAALTRGRPGARYVLAGENLTNDQFYSLLCREIDPTLRPQPIALAWITVLGVVAELLGWLGIDLDFSMDTRRLSGYYWWGDARLAQQELGFSRKFTAEETIRRTVAWHARVETKE